MTTNTNNQANVETQENVESTDPRFTFFPMKNFDKGPSLVFLLHHYGQSLSDARYKTERLLAGESINATLPDVEGFSAFYADVAKLGLKVELQNKDTFQVSQ